VQPAMGSLLSAQRSRRCPMRIEPAEVIESFYVAAAEPE